jgi:hypothetical protein
MARSRFYWLLPPLLAFTPVSCYQPANSSAPAVRSSSGRTAAVGSVAPNIEGTDVDGKSMNLSDFRGKVVLLDFWATT